MALYDIPMKLSPGPTLQHFIYNTGTIWQTEYRHENNWANQYYDNDRIYKLPKAELNTGQFSTFVFHQILISLTCNLFFPKKKKDVFSLKKLLFLLKQLFYLCAYYNSSAWYQFLLLLGKTLQLP